MFLTILIPTYNRKEKLNRTFDCLEKQSCQEFFVIVSDNCSDYDVNDLLKNRDKDFVSRIAVIKNDMNIGAEGNYFRLLTHSPKTEWIWMIADDDIIPVDAIETIKTDVISNSECAWIDYPVCPNSFSKQYRFSSIVEYLDFSFKNSEILTRDGQNPWGSLVYIASKVYNWERIKDVIPYAVEYSYTRMVAAILVLKSLEMGKTGMISPKTIIFYDAEDGVAWNMQSTMLAVRTFEDIPFNLEKGDLKRLWKLCAPGFIYYPQMAVQYMQRHEKPKFPGMGFDIVYYDMYKRFLPWHMKVFWRLLILCSKSKVLYGLGRKVALDINLQRKIYHLFVK